MTISDKELTLMLDDIGKNWETFKEKNTGTINALEDRIDGVEGQLDGLGPREQWAGRGSADRKALDHWLRTGDRADQLGPGQSKALSLGGGSDILAPEIIANEILKFAKESSGLVQRVRQTTASSGDYHRVTRVDVPTATWVSETGTRSDSADILYRDRALVGGEIFYVFGIWNWLLDDSQFNLANEFVQETGQGFARALDNAILNGSGTNEPIGLLNSTPVGTADFASPLRNADTIEAINAPSPDSIVDHMLDALFTLNPAYRARTIWAMNSSTLAEVRKAKDSQGQPVFQNVYATGVDQGDGSLFGKPVIVSEFMPDIGQSPAAASMLVGDFTAAYELVRIGDGSGFTIIRDQVTVKGQTKLYLAARYLGRPIINDAVKAVMR